MTIGLLNPYAFGGGVASGYDTEVLADSPLVYLRLADTSGTTAADSSGNSRNGTIDGSPSLAQSGLLASSANTCISFDGSNDKVRVPHASWMTAASAFTVECLFRTTTTSGESVVVGRLTATPGNAACWCLRRNGNKIELRWNTNGAGGWNQIDSGAGSIATNTNYHVVGTYDGTTYKLYLNGTQVASSAGSAYFGDVTGLSVGSWYDGLAEWFTGKIDEVALYGTALNSTRVAAHYAAV